MVDPIMKYKLAESIDDSDFNFSDPSFYEIGGVCLSLNYSGRNETKVKSFLSQYLNTFKTTTLIALFNKPFGKYLSYTKWYLLL